MTNEEFAIHWKNNAEVLERWNIPADILGKQVKLDRGGYGKIAGIHPNSKRPFRISYIMNGQSRVISTTLEGFQKMARCYL